jgi:hypothetical protein
LLDQSGRVRLATIAAARTTHGRSGQDSGERQMDAGGRHPCQGRLWSCVARPVGAARLALTRAKRSFSTG